MPSVDVTKQNPYQFKQYFREWLNKYIRDTFNVNDVLMFVTWQPPKPQWSSVKVIEHSQQLFGGVKNVTVIEQTFEKSNMYNYADYIDGYHSHLIMTESDYGIIKHELKGHDVVAKVVYDLEGLKYYLTKQAGDTYNRTLPMLNIPISQPQPLETITTVVVVKYLTKLVAPAMPVFQNVSKTYRISKRFTTKIDIKHRFIDDT